MNVVDCVSEIWNQTQGLPSDMSAAENAAMTLKSLKYPLVIDPQLIAINWLKQKEGNNLLVGRMGQKDLLKNVLSAVSSGQLFLIENIGEIIDHNLFPIINRITIKRGVKNFLLINDEELEVHENFRLILHTKLSNPYFHASIQSCVAIINFSVTEDGLIDHLLVLTLKFER